MTNIDDCKVVAVARRETGSLLINDYNSDTSDDNIETFKNGITQNLQDLQSFKGLLEYENKFRKFKENRILVLDDEEFCIASMKAIFFTIGVDINF